MTFAELERCIVDYFEAMSCDVEQDGAEWKLSLYDEGPAISLTGLAAALLERKSSKSDPQQDAISALKNWNG